MHPTLGSLARFQAFFYASAFFQFDGVPPPAPAQVTHAVGQPITQEDDMAFAIKADISDPSAETFTFNSQKTMYSGKHIVEGEKIFIFASENKGGLGLIASGIVTSATTIAKKTGIARQTPRVSITIRRTALAKKRLGRSELKLFSDWNDGRPETELNFKFYRQLTNKIVGISDETAAFLCDFF